MSNGSDSVQGQGLWVLIWVQTVCEGYQVSKVTTWRQGVSKIHLEYYRFLSSADFNKIKNKSPSYTIRVSNSLDLNQDLRNVGPHLGPTDFNIVITFQIHKKLSCFPQLI